MAEQRAGGGSDDGRSPESWAASRAEYDWYSAQYWAMRRARDGYRVPLTASQHILHLLLTIFTGGLWAIVWIIRASQGNRVPPDPAAPALSGRPRGKALG